MEAGLGASVGDLVRRACAGRGSRGGIGDGCECGSPPTEGGPAPSISSGALEAAGLDLACALLQRNRVARDLLDGLPLPLPEALALLQDLLTRVCPAVEGQQTPAACWGVRDPTDNQPVLAPSESALAMESADFADTVRFQVDVLKHAFKACDRSSMAWPEDLVDLYQTLSENLQRTDDAHPAGSAGFGESQPQSHPIHFHP